MITETDKLLARTTRTTTRRPQPPRQLRFDPASNLLTWIRPARGVEMVTHYRIRLESDSAAPQYEVPVGQSTLQLTPGVHRVFVTAYNQINDLESAMVWLQILPSGGGDGGGGTGAVGNITLHPPPTVRFSGEDTLLSFDYDPPSPLGDFSQVHVYLYAPDPIVDNPATVGISSGFFVPADASDAAVAQNIPDNTAPVDKGIYAYSPGHTIIQFKHPRPKKKETWRAIFISGTPENPVKGSPFMVFDVDPANPSGGGLPVGGAEWGPNVRNGHGKWYEDTTGPVTTWWFKLWWDLPTEDPRYKDVAEWQVWVYDPTKPDDPATPDLDEQYNLVARLAPDATSFTLPDRWTITPDPVMFTLFVVPADKDGRFNPPNFETNKVAEFLVVLTSGLRLHFADGTSIDGIDFEVDEDRKVFKIKNLDLQKAFGPSYSSEFKIVGGVFQFGDNQNFSKFDPTKLPESFDLDSSGNLLFNFNPTDFDEATGIFTFKSLRNEIIAQSGLFDPGLGFIGTLVSGVIYAGALKAEQIQTGVLRVGGFKSATDPTRTYPGRLSVYDNSSPTPQLVGWIGTDDTVANGGFGTGYAGGWMKRLLIGGSSPSSPAISVDQFGNMTILQGIFSAGTIQAGVAYLGQVNATQVNAGLLTGHTLYLDHSEPDGNRYVAEWNTSFSAIGGSHTFTGVKIWRYGASNHMALLINRGVVCRNENGVTVAACVSYNGDPSGGNAPTFYGDIWSADTAGNITCEMDGNLGQVSSKNGYRVFSLGSWRVGWNAINFIGAGGQYWCVEGGLITYMGASPRP